MDLDARLLNYYVIFLALKTLKTFLPLKSHNLFSFFTFRYYFFPFPIDIETFICTATYKHFQMDYNLQTFPLNLDYGLWKQLILSRVIRSISYHRKSLLIDHTKCKSIKCYT